MVLMEILEKRIVPSKSTIVCSQRDPGNRKAMTMNNNVSVNAIMKRATKHYIVAIQPIETTLIRVAVGLCRLTLTNTTHQWTLLGANCNLPTCQNIPHFTICFG